MTDIIDAIMDKIKAKLPDAGIKRTGKSTWHKHGGFNCIVGWDGAFGDYMTGGGYWLDVSQFEIDSNKNPMQFDDLAQLYADKVIKYYTEAMTAAAA